MGTRALPKTQPAVDRGDESLERFADYLELETIAVSAAAVRKAANN
jgi:hypothetical protein